MTSISSIETITPNLHSSVLAPSSPSDNEDLGRQRVWDDTDDFHSPASPSASSSGKRRANVNVPLYREESASADIDPPDSGVYPPMNDDEAETRRVEENLRRWDIAERQRRKATRESYTNTVPTSSVVSNVGWRASSLWRKTGQAREHALGQHTALQSEDSVDLPMESIAATPGPSPGHSPTPPDTDDDPENPFANPPAALSPFADPQQTEAVMSAATEPLPDDDGTRPLVSPVPERPTLQAQSSSFSRPPPPKPLNLPPPRTPPPPIDTPPHAVSTPTVDQGLSQVEEEERETRWWHEWLCGCGEGADRGGEHQAGRTNPLE